MAKPSRKGPTAGENPFVKGKGPGKFPAKKGGLSGDKPKDRKALFPKKKK